MANRKELNLEEMDQVNGGLQACAGGGGLSGQKKEAQGDSTEYLVKSIENAVDDILEKPAAVKAAVSEIAMGIID